ncbi:MAG: tetratricopeptide repeat protein, partial [Candidatus Binatia bacterium]
DDSLPIAHIAVGFRKGQNPSAIGFADRAVALGGNDARIHALAALIHLALGHIEDAIRLLEKAKELDPRAPDWIRFNLGAVYALAQRHEEALPLLEKVVSAHPDYVYAHTTLLQLYEKLGRPEKAAVEQRELDRLLGPSLPEEVAASAPAPSPTASDPAAEFLRLR